MEKEPLFLVLVTLTKENSKKGIDMEEEHYCSKLVVIVMMENGNKIK